MSCRGLVAFRDKLGLSAPKRTKRPQLLNAHARRSSVTRTFQSHVHAIAGIASATEFDFAVLRERFVALKRQLPWLYAIMIANVIAIQMLVRHRWLPSLVPAAVILTIIAARSIQLRRLAPATMSDDAIRAELTRTFIIAVFCFGMNVVWIVSLFLRLDRDTRVDVAMLAGVAATGASTGLSSFPAAARIPLLFVAIPCGVALAFENAASHTGIGASLVVLALIGLRMIAVVDENFKRLVRSRFTIDAERRRALEAEQSTLAEKQRVIEIANTDALTGISNRRGFRVQLDGYGRSHRRKLGLVLLDLDGFKSINDTFGHAEGDALLIEVARRLQALAGWQMPVARLGGDEFAFVCQADSAAEAVRTAERVVQTLCRPFHLKRRDIRLSACAGVSWRGGADVSEAMRRADIALLDAKGRGRGHVSSFSVELEEEVLRRTAIEQALRHPGFAEQIELQYQPIFDLRTMELSSFEALARWHHPQLGLISPAEFIPISEQISVLQEVTDELLRRAAEAACTWPDQVRLSFNLSPVQLCSSDAAKKILRVVQEAGLDPARLQMEVTETAIMADFEVARHNLSRLRRSGVSIALDDFGAGYSSISYLRQMNFDAIKLDGSLIGTLQESGTGPRLLIGVLGLCSAMDQHCIAEHIEDFRQLEMLRDLGCRYGQGFALSPPLHREAARALAHSATGAEVHLWRGAPANKRIASG